MHRDTGLPGACTNMLFFASNAMEAPASTYGRDNAPFDGADWLGLPSQTVGTKTPPLT